MERLSIDLLPLEFKTEEAKRAKFYKIQTIGVITILIMVFFSSLTIALRVLQSQEISKVKNDLSQNEQKVTDLKTSQAQLVLLKNRLTAINQYFGVPSKQVEMYNLIEKLLPFEVSISSIAVDKSGDVLLLALSSSSDSIDQFISNLISPDKNEDKISEVSVESLSRGRDGVYRLSFKVKPKAEK